MGTARLINSKVRPKTRFIVSQCLNDFSGSPRVLADFCGTEKIQSQELTIITSSSNGFLSDDLGEKVTIWHPRGPSRVANILSFGFAQVQLAFQTFLLIKRSRKLGEKVVVVNNTILSLGSMLVGRLYGATNIAYIHEVSVGPPVLGLIFRFFARLVIKLTADEIIFVSRYLVTEYKLDRKKVTIIPNGLRSDFNPSIELNLEEKFDSKKILFIGYLKKKKGLYELLKIANKMPGIPFVAVLNCSVQSLEKFKYQVQVPENLELYASHHDLQLLYKEAFLVMNLSLPDACIESFALTILEGMFFGCPVIVPEIGGHFQYFDSQAGLAADARDVEKIVNFITGLQDDFCLWESYSVQARGIAEDYSALSYRMRVNEFLSRYC